MPPIPKDPNRSTLKIESPTALSPAWVRLNAVSEGDSNDPAVKHAAYLAESLDGFRAALERAANAA